MFVHYIFFIYWSKNITRRRQDNILFIVRWHTANTEKYKQLIELKDMSTRRGLFHAERPLNQINSTFIFALFV